MKKILLKVFTNWLNFDKKGSKCKKLLKITKKIVDKMRGKCRKLINNYEKCYAQKLAYRFLDFVIFDQFSEFFTYFCLLPTFYPIFDDF